MATRIERIGNNVVFTDLVTGIVDEYPADNVYHRNEDNDIFAFNHKFNHAHIRSYNWNELRDKDGNVWADKATIKAWLRRNLGDAGHYTNGGLDVVLQDPTTPLMVVEMSNIIAETTTTSPLSIDDTVVNVVSSTGFITGQYLTIYNVSDNRVFFARVKLINTNAITVDRPIDFIFPSGSFVTVGNTNMAVNGSVTPQVFGVRNPGGQDVPLKFDITRIMFYCLASSAVDLSKFGDIAGGLEDPVVLRRIDGDTRNIMSFKTNGELKQIIFNLDILSSANPQQGQDGFTGRFTVAGQSKLGAVIRIGANEDFQCIIQDDLSSLTYFGIIVEGSEVSDE